jgi:hypothetical protein
MVAPPPRWQHRCPAFATPAMGGCSSGGRPLQLAAATDGLCSSDDERLQQRASLCSSGDGRLQQRRPAFEAPATGGCSTGGRCLQLRWREAAAAPAGLCSSGHGRFAALTARGYNSSGRPLQLRPRRFAAPAACFCSSGDGGCSSALLMSRGWPPRRRRHLVAAAS